MRAELKHQDSYPPGLVAQLDQELLAGGAGAKRRLTSYRADTPAPEIAPESGEGASTPGEAWDTMLTKWAGKGMQSESDIYTEMTKLAMGDQNKPEQRVVAALDHWQNAQYRVLQDRNHAVIHFAESKGWNNAPFLFCKTSRGWKFDIVHQRRLVVMGPNSSWMVQQGNYPYVHLLTKVPQSTGKDLPLGGEDLYFCEQDEEIAERIAVLEKSYRDRPNDFSAVMSLARLNVITGRRPNHVHSLLKQARKLDPDNPEPDKYSAIYNVNTFFQYKTALEDIKTYLEKRPRDPFGYNFLGFLHYRLGDYQDSIDVLREAVQIDSDNVYAYALMARDFALLYRKASSSDPRRPALKAAALSMLNKARTAPTPDARRVAWLESWLERQKIL